MEGLVGIFLFLCIAVIWGAYIFSKHRERMTIIEKGLNPEELKSLYAKNWRFAVSPLSSLKWGILLVMVGAGLMLGIWLQEMYYLNGGFVPGLMAVAGGLGLVIFYFIAPKNPQS